MTRLSLAVLGIILSPVLFAAAGEGGAGLAGALKKLAAADSYAFTVEEGPGGMGTLEAKYQKGRPLYGKAEKIELFQQGKAVAYREGEKWEKSRTGTLSDPLRVLGAVSKIRKVRLPQEELKDLPKRLKDVKKEQDGKGVVFTGTLTPEAARDLAPIEFRDLARGGAVKLHVNEAGELTKYHVAVRVQGRLGNAEVDGTQERTVTLRGVGATKVEVPEAARKALE